jgi:hypothetical protein
MVQDNAELMARMKQARDKLAAQFINHPDVSLIDIGADPESSAQSASVALRVHVRRSSTKSALGIPDEIDGVPVRVVIGDYHLE